MTTKELTNKFNGLPIEERKRIGDLSLIFELNIYRRQLEQEIKRHKAAVKDIKYMIDVIEKTISKIEDI